MGGINHLGKGGIRESDTDSDNGKAGAEELLSAVWRRRVRVVLRRRGGGGGCLSRGGGGLLNFYSDFLILSNTNGMRGVFNTEGEGVVYCEYNCLL